MMSQQYGCLNKTYTSTLPTDMLIVKKQISQALHRQRTTASERMLRAGEIAKPR